MDIGNLIQKATKVPPEANSSVYTVSDSLLIPIKTLCKSDPDALLSAFHYLSVDLKRKNGCVRLRSLFIINELFQRSKLFRSEVSQNISTIVNCAGFLHTMTNEINNSSLAASHRAELESKVKELIETWDVSYGNLYPEIHATARFFKETLKLTMPNILARRRQAEEDALIRIEQQRRVILLQSSKIVEEMKYTSLQVSNIIDRIEECFNILFPRLYNVAVIASEKDNTSFSDDNFDDVDWIESEVAATPPSQSTTLDLNYDRGSATVDLEAIGAVPYTLAFTLDTTAKDVSTADNEILISVVRELSKQLVNHIVPKLLQWKSTLTKGLEVLINSGDGPTSNSSSGNNNSSSSSSSSGGGGHKRMFEDADNVQLTREALSKTKQMLEQIHVVLIRKCKELLKKV